MPGIEHFARRQREAERLAAETRLRGADFRTVSESLQLMFQMMKADAEERGGRWAVNAEYLATLRPFIENPTLETAVALVTALPSMWDTFDSSKKPFGDLLVSDEAK